MMPNAAKKSASLTIVAGISADHTGEAAWQRAVALARDVPDSHLHVLHAVQSFEEDPTRALEEGERRLKPWVEERLEGDPLAERCTVHVGVRPPADELRQLAVDARADYIVVGTHHKGGIRRLVEGSVVHDLLKDAPCSVLVAMPDDFDSRQASPRIEPAPPKNAAEPNIANPHVYRYRRSLRVNQPQSTVGVGQV